MAARRRKPHRTLSLFTGAGGLDIGLEAAGFEVALCIELDQDCRSTLATNRPQWRLSEPGDIFALTPKEAMRQGRFKEGELTLLSGGPPCQPFSKSSYWVNGDSARLDDPRSNTLGSFLDFSEELLPRVLLLENVKGLVFSGKDEGLKLFQTRLDEINRRHGVAYAASVASLNCADFGVPQARERIFIVADREGTKFAAPEPTHHPPDTLGNGNEQVHRTAWDAIGDLDDDQWPDRLNPRGKWADLLRSIPEGENYLWHTPRGDGEPLFGWRTRFWSFLLKLAKDRPAWTIQASPGPATGPFHWKSRRLSTAELCRVQTFPDDYVVEGDFRSQHRQIGNSVPPAVGYLLGSEIRRQLLGEKVAKQNPFVPDVRPDCPAPQTPASVDPKFLNLRGNHEDHPGVGQGPSARLRQSKQEE